MGMTIDSFLLELASRLGGPVYTVSLRILEDSSGRRLTLWMQMTSSGKRLAVMGGPDEPRLQFFHGEVEAVSGEPQSVAGSFLKLCPADVANSQALRAVLPSLQPVPLGLVASAGFGDRLGLATPGHVRALHQVMKGSATRPIAPIFAQQSIREMSRSERTPEQVLSDATWGALEAGWQGPVGADADHLKTAADIDACAEAGFSLYTIDPGEYVDSDADRANSAIYTSKVEALPWDVLESSPSDLLRRYADHVFDLGERQLTISREDALRAAAKYGRAVAHIVELYRHLELIGIPFELEVSVDETETPTSHAEHYYVASELRRLGIHWVSLAPRFVGRFEKGVDYIGDLPALAADLIGHALIARVLGPYKLSLHSGSDKFSVYPLIADATRGLVHLKTAGTSYLEALRVIAGVDPIYFREVLAFAREHYVADRLSYHVSARVERVPSPNALFDADLPKLLDQFDARQVLHVTYGSVLGWSGERLKAVLRANEEAHYAALQKHFERHLRPFSGVVAHPPYPPSLGVEDSQ
jgi:hypothetical protein